MPLLFFIGHTTKKYALLDSEVLSNDFTVYCILKRDTVYSGSYGPRESSFVSSLCRTAGLTRVYRIAPFNRRNFFIVFERSQCLEKIQI
jgi:hypothetical protein